MNILLVVHIIIHYKTCHQEVEIYKREHYVGTFMIYSGTRPCILHLSIPMLIKCVPSFTSYCIRGYFFPNFIFTQCTTHLMGISKNVICILKTWKQIWGRFKTKWAHGFLPVGESNMRLNNIYPFKLYVFQSERLLGHIELIIAIDHKKF